MNNMSVTNGNVKPRATPLTGSENLSPDAVKAYLKTHPQLLETFVVSSAVPKHIFQRWVNKRAAKEAKSANGRKADKLNDSAPVNRSLDSNGADWKSLNLASKRRLLLELSTQSNAGGFRLLLFELANACSQIIDADGYNLYLIDSDTHDLSQYILEADGTVKQALLKKSSTKQVTIAQYVAKSEEPARTENVFTDPKFPGGTGNTQTDIRAVLCQPLLDCSGTLIGVLELYRLSGNGTFTRRDEQSVNILTTWACSETYFSQIFTTMNKQRKLNDFLLNVAKSIFQDIISMDAVIMKVMNFAQKLVNADRASLFLVDGKTNELYARIFDVGTGSDEHGNLDSEGQKEIRLARSLHHAAQHLGLNIDDAYNDPRFNSEVDSKTGYTTKTILCMPIFIRGSVIGVVQMVNKTGGAFTKADEDAFETFAIYCGLALHHAKLYDKIRRSEQKYRVALEVLAYHSVCNKDEVNKLKKVKLRDRIVELETFDFNALKLSELEKPLYAVYMFKNLFGSRFDGDDLIRFILTVRKNYRRVPYHNWTHGWSVAHAMFVVLKVTDHFTPLEQLALYVSSLCHDLDHRGKNNAYMKNMSTPLASIYSTSVMEHHHFNQTVTILQQDGHNILKALSSDEYKQVLSSIKHCILATDLALFFPNKGKLTNIIANGGINWENNDHRALMQAVLMTSCDLIASAKPWEVQTETVKVIFEEFYEQGDAERVNGREPIPMMNRQKAHELPQMQVGFMNGICVPCYDLLAQVMPCAVILSERSRYNSAKWQELADEQQMVQEAKEKEANKRKGKAGD
uniref:Phosphodiesterase n=1 Tax=Plectus sambesii TaxID=2011161 RepID=A0A914WWF4_9BILA